jgi:hypothetical protein
MGKKIDIVEVTESCMSCIKWISCNNPLKARKFSCEKYDNKRESISLDFLDDLDNVEFSSKKEEDEFFNAKAVEIDELLERYLDSDLPVSKDLKVDDSHIPQMKNFYDFCFNDEWGFRGIKPFARQLWIGLKLFGEICPVCTKKKYFKKVTGIRVNYDPEKITKKLTLLEHGVCPKCKARKHQLVKKGKLPVYSELAHISGQRSGKSVATSFYITYLVHKFLKLQKPAELILGVPNQYLVGTVVAPNMKDCMTLLWRPVLDAMGDSPWFDAYHKLMYDSNKKYKVDSFKIKDTYLDYGFRKILLAPQAANLRTLRGKSRFFSGVDELDYFDANGDDKITISGHGIWDALNMSLATAFTECYNLLMRGYDNIPIPVAFNISSPCKTPGVLSEMVENPVSGVMALRTPTWEINPKMPRNSPAIQKAYEKNPIQAETNFGANPPANGSPFISTDTKLDLLFTATKNRVTYQYEHLKDDFDGEMRIYRYAKITNCNSSNYVWGSVLSMDCGVSNNSFSLTVGHKEKGKVVYDVVIEIIPEHKKNILHYERIINDVVKELIRQFNVKVVLADRWNSLYLLHQLGTEFPQLLVCKQYSVKYVDFEMFRSYILDQGICFSKLEMPAEQCVQLTGDYPNCFYYKPFAHLYNQIFTVQDTGKNVDKGIGRTDDTFRAMVLGGVYLCDPKHDKLLFHKQKNKGSRALISDGAGAAGSGAFGKNGRGIIAGR